jgi:hypothetical protein
MVDGAISSAFVTNGRFHDPRILAATGKGLEIEEKRAWKGFWNEKLVQISKQCFEDPEALTVLLTGRSTAYCDLITRILRSKNLNFDLVVLKPKKERGASNSTLTFKYAFIDDVLKLGKTIDEVEVYEDRAPHRDAFEDYLKNWRRLKETTTEEEDSDGIKRQTLELEEQNDNIGLKAFKVHFVEMPFLHLDEELEESLVQIMLDELNTIDLADEPDQWIMQKKIFSLGYEVSTQDFEELFETYFSLIRDNHLANRREWRPIRQPSVFIYFNAQPHILHKVGGIGKQVEFEVTHFAVSEKVFALHLAPIASFHEITSKSGATALANDSRTRFWSKNETPVLVLATREGGKPVDANYLKKWTAVPQSVENRRFRARVAVKQEISMERVPRAEAEELAKAMRTQESPQTVNRRHSRDRPDTRKNNQYKKEGSNTRNGCHSVYGSQRGSGSRNAFGYSLERDT